MLTLDDLTMKAHETLPGRMFRACKEHVEDDFDRHFDLETWAFYMDRHPVHAMRVGHCVVLSVHPHEVGVDLTGNVWKAEIEDGVQAWTPHTNPDTAVEEVERYLKDLCTTRWRDSDPKSRRIRKQKVEKDLARCRRAAGEARAKEVELFK